MSSQLNQKINIDRSKFWKAGYLSYKLYDYQVPLYNLLIGAIKDPSCLKYVLNCSRRWGKSTILCLIATEYCLRNPNSLVRFAAPTGKALKKIIIPIMRLICKDAPEQYKPKFRALDAIYVFHNGSELHMAGTDGGNAESLRGQTSHLNVIDEAGFCDDLDYLMKSILMPQTLTTGGKTLLASTPSKTPAHDFHTIAQECKEAGHYMTYTIYDNPSISEKTRELYAKEAGGFESSTWKREYLCQFVVDANSVRGLFSGLMQAQQTK